MSGAGVRLLDLFCGAGGAAVGYARAGFEVVGVDIAPMPNYPFEFHQGDATTFPLEGFDFIHASPPCQDHSPLSALVGSHGTGWILPRMFERLSAQPTPWIVENVMGAAMGADLVLCGGMFGLRTYRHRKFTIDPRFPILSRLAASPATRHQDQYQEASPRLQPRDAHQRHRGRRVLRRPGLHGHRLDDWPRVVTGDPTAVHGVHRQATPGPSGGRRMTAPDPLDRFERQHRDCEAPWECRGCGRLVCWRCDPSPAEPQFCSECAFFGGAA